MARSRLAGLVLVLAAVCGAETATAQLFGRVVGGNRGQAPRIEAIMPPGLTAGRTNEVTVRGQDLGLVDRWLFSEAGIEVKRVVDQNSNEVRLELTVAGDCSVGLCEVRGLAPGGLSNLALVQVDTLPQVVEEAKENGTSETAQGVGWDCSVGGVLESGDVDCYRIEGKRGQRGVFEVEAERLGTAIAPVLTLMGPDGKALRQARGSKGLGRDVRMVFTVPRDGAYYLQVHDNIYAGNNAAVYRLRIRENGRFATGLFPLGGPAGWTVRVEASGGDLEAPRVAYVRLPEEPGRVVEGTTLAFSGPGGAVRVPMRMVVGGKGSEEIVERTGAEFTRLEVGQAVCGRIERAGEVDRYRVKLGKDQMLNLSVRAEELGSWLDSVVRVVDVEGNEVAVNDDPGERDYQPFSGQGPQPTDSRLKFRAPREGTYTVEVYDRYGEGGPEYAYRLETGEKVPDFDLKILVDPNSNNRRNVFGRRGANPVLPGSTGSLNLAPGSSTTLNFLVTPHDRFETIEVRAEGLPFGVSAEAVEIRNAREGVPAGRALTLKVDPNAAADLGRFRLVARGKTREGRELTRVGRAEVIIDTPVYQNVYQRPITRELRELPLWVAGDTREAERRPGFVGPPRPVALKVAEVKNPGVLLQGDRVDLGLVLVPSDPAPGTYMVEGEAEGKGLGVQTLVTEMGGSMPEEGEASAVVRVVAATDAAPGVRKVTLRVRPLKGKVIEREEEVEVQVPVRVVVAPEPIELGEDGTGMVRVELERRKGAEGSVELKLGLPRGVRVADRRALVVPRRAVRAVVPIALESGAKLQEGGKMEVVVTGKIRMPGGSVKVEGEVRPMLRRRAAEK